MKESIFRQKSIDRISSPEQFDEYVKVSTPGVWVSMFAILILITGFLVWCLFGQLDTVVDAAVVSDGNTAICYVEEDNLIELETGMEVKTDTQVLTITRIDSTPVYMTEAENATAVHILGQTDDCWLCVCTLKSKDEVLPAGTYSAKILIESIKPMTFITN